MLGKFLFLETWDLVLVRTSSNIRPMILALHAMIDEDPGVPMRRLTINLHFVKRQLEEPFMRTSATSLKIRQALNDDTKAKRLPRCEFLVCS